MMNREDAKAAKTAHDRAVHGAGAFFVAFVTFVTPW